MNKKLISLYLIVLFFAACNKPGEIVEFNSSKLLETSQSWNGDYLLEYPQGKPKITVLKITIPPHHKLNMHKHPVINAGVITKGQLSIVDENNNTLELKAGDALVELVNQFHYGENKGNSATEIIVFYAGVEGTPITITKE